MNKEQSDAIKIHTESFIKGFFDEYRWLSNFHTCEVVYKGLTFTSAEAAYQSAKTDDEYLKTKFTQVSPSKSKFMGANLKCIKDWDKIKPTIMYEILVDKFTRNFDLRQQLIATGTKHLEETNYWGDTFWGVCNGKGKNILGEILMRVRAEITINKEL